MKRQFRKAIAVLLLLSCTLPVVSVAENTGIEAAETEPADSIAAPAEKITEVPPAIKK